MTKESTTFARLTSGKPKTQRPPRPKAEGKKTNNRELYLEKKRKMDQRSADVRAKAVEAKLAKEAAYQEKMELAKRRKEAMLREKHS